MLRLFMRHVCLTVHIFWMKDDDFLKIFSIECYVAFCIFDFSSSLYTVNISTKYAKLQPTFLVLFSKQSFVFWIQRLSSICICSAERLLFYQKFQFLKDNNNNNITSFMKLRSEFPCCHVVCPSQLRGSIFIT